MSQTFGEVREEPQDNIRKDSPEWVQSFKDYPWENDKRERVKDKPLARNSKLSYFNKLRACLNQAFDDRIIAHNPIRGIEGFKAEEGTRMYLTIDELKKLSHTKCEYPNIKKAFLFSCLTGLRRSDILKLTWGEFHEQGEFTRIIFKQKKTNGQEYLDITQQAAELMGERGKSNERVFGDIYSPSCTNEAIKRWVLRAGIDKEITFHSYRHTFAVLALATGGDIYTVGKLLGHTSINSTQVYADVVMETKIEAINRISTFFSK